MAPRKSLAAALLFTLALARCAASGSPAPLPEAGGTSLEALAEARPAEPARGWQAGEIAALAERLVGDPGRFVADAAFRAMTWSRLAGPLPESVPPELARLVAGELNQYRGVDFGMSEALERAWALVPRGALDRRELPGAGHLRLPSDSAGRIAVSLYSLPSWFFSGDESRAFLSALRRHAPEREIVALVDPELARALAPTARDLHLHLLDTLGRGYSPWPRDPFAVGRRAGGGVTFLVRPNRQEGREDDAFLAQELIQNLPPRLDQALGEPRWALAPRPFHNGQMLVTDRDLWLSLHSVEIRALELLRLDRVPVETFGESAGIERYVGAARQAARELGEIFGRQARFVHPLPSGGSLPDDRALMRTLSGGAGFDLDSLVTLLEPPRGGGGGGGIALVADPAFGGGLVRRLGRTDAQVLLERYRLRGDPESVLRELAATAESPRTLALAEFLARVASELREQGWQIRRLPMLRVPLSMREDRESIQLPDFLLTWNNVVLETRDGRLRAEGFASLLPTADAEALGIFREAGAELTLLPPLLRSVILSGGYRCASNHVRAP